MYYFLANYFWHSLPFLSWCIHQIDSSHPLLPGCCHISVLTGRWNIHSKSHICWDSKPHFSEFKGSCSLWTWTLLNRIFGSGCSQGMNIMLFTIWHRDHVDKYRGLDEDREHFFFLPNTHHSEERGVDFGKSWGRKHYLSGCWCYIMVIRRNVLKGAYSL